MFTVELSNKKSFSADDQKSLLDSANKDGVVLEYSCRTGQCGICKAKVLQGASAVIQNELAITEQESKEGYILTCCRAAKSDLRLDIEDLGEFASIEVKTLPCRIDSINKKATDVLEIILRLPPNSSFDYIAGQYIDVIGRNGIRRSYSIANSKREDKKIELQIRQVSDGVMSQYWFEEASEGDLLRLEGPLGTFGLRNSTPTNFIFLATGTGIAPIKAILEKIYSNPIEAREKKIWVYWGGRVLEDIYWNPNFSLLDLEFIPVLSRSGSEYSGRKGYVQNAVLEDEVDLNDSVVYACGSDLMINSAREQLTNKGLPEKLFFSDAFVSST